MNQAAHSDAQQRGGYDYRYTNGPAAEAGSIDRADEKSFRNCPGQGEASMRPIFHRCALLGDPGWPTTLRNAPKSRQPRSAALLDYGRPASALKNSSKDIGNSLPPGHLAALIRTLDSGEISGKIAKTVFEEMCRTAEEPATVIKRMGLVQVSDEASLSAVIDRILALNPKQLAEYRSGKTKVMGFFVGQIMKETKGQANPQVVNELLQKKLSTG
jgi:Asp-tRNA(Asn)/Glu-tRNA(Gln) amidotransferase B subunit